MHTTDDDRLALLIQREAARLVIDKGIENVTLADVAKKINMSEEQLCSMASSVPHAIVGTAFEGMTSMIQDYLGSRDGSHFIDRYLSHITELYKVRESEPDYNATMKLVQEAADKELAVRGAQYEQLRELQAGVADVVVTYKGWDEGDSRAWATGTLVNAMLIGAIEAFANGDAPSISAGIEKIRSALDEIVVDPELTSHAHTRLQAQLDS